MPPSPITPAAATITPPTNPFPPPPPPTSLTSALRHLTITEFKLFLRDRSGPIIGVGFPSSS